MSAKSYDAAHAEAAKNYLDKNYGNKISIRDLAEEIGVGEKTLSRAFKKAYKKRVYEYLLELRMEKAKEYLEDNKPVKQVASLVGYKRPSSFTKRFNKHFGTTPSNWENN